MAAMQQIADWLKTLGMSEYAERFAENRIDFSVLPDLTDQDLKELGVVLGDRRKMLRAIAELGSAPAAHLHRHSRLSRRHRCVCAAAILGPGRSRRRAPASDGDVLRSGRFDRDFSSARCRGVARPGRRLSQRRFGGGDGDGRPCRQEARRRADVAVRLSGSAGERFRTRGAGGAVDPARACRTEPQE